jgi:hypothetical protein
VTTDNEAKGIDRVLDLLSKPLSRYILSVLAGIDPGTFEGCIETPDESKSDENEGIQ